LLLHWLNVDTSTATESVRAVFVALLLLSTCDVEPNPGPGRTTTINQLIKLGCFNCRFIVGKIALIHDLIAERNVDVLALSETWITSDMLSAYLLTLLKSASQSFISRINLPRVYRCVAAVTPSSTGSQSWLNAVRSPTISPHPLLNCRSFVSGCSCALTPSSAFTTPIAVR
jgi:hypothetical protein